RARRNRRREVAGAIRRCGDSLQLIIDGDLLAVLFPVKEEKRPVVSVVNFRNPHWTPQGEPIVGPTVPSSRIASTRRSASIWVTCIKHFVHEIVVPLPWNRLVPDFIVTLKKPPPT